VVAFEDMAKVCTEALDFYFPEEDEFGFKTNIKIIAEPGRFYVASAFILATMVVAKRAVTDENGEKGMMYYLNDGVYGSFNCTIFDHYSVTPKPFLDEDVVMEQRRQLKTTLWGPTCDSMDLIKKDVYLPELEVGEWILFEEMGAYTIAAASQFNGFQLPTMKYLLPIHTLEALRTWPSWSRIAKIVDFEEETSDDELELRDQTNNQPTITAVADVDHHLELIPVH
jgi:diaminopimelate decarboxylase